MHFLNLDSMDACDIVDFYNSTLRIQKGRNLGAWEAKSYLMQHKVMATLFFEPSTRTRLSFEVAMKRMGGSVVSSVGEEMLSTAKGESMADTIETVGQMVDVIVVRSSEPCIKWFNRSSNLPPIINAGDGPHNHPTQALLDGYTIWKHFENFADVSLNRFAMDNYSHVVIGDLGMSRAIRSYVQLADKFHHQLHLYDSSGKNNKVPNVALKNAKYHKKLSEIESIFKETDALYLNRIQKERSGWTLTTFDFTERHAEMLKPEALILNPGPCLEELPYWARERYQRVKVNQQVENGVFVRMALLERLVGSARG